MNIKKFLVKAVLLLLLLLGCVVFGSILLTGFMVLTMYAIYLFGKVAGVLMLFAASALALVVGLALVEAIMGRFMKVWVKV